MQASSARGDVLAIASRDQARAAAAAERLGIPRAYSSYEELLDDPDIDAVYNPLPNHLHVPWSVRALEAGKHVLCEKPLAQNVAEAMILVEAGKRHPALKVMEAFMYKFHPQWQKVRSLVQEGAIGELRTVATTFAYFLDDGANIRNMAAIGGGGLLDIGCYAISVPRLLFNSEPVRLVATLEFDPRFETDRLDSAILQFRQGTATFTCSTQLDSFQRVTVHGTSGSIEVEIPFNAPTDRPCKLFYRHGDELDEILIDTCDQYALQADAFAEAILWNQPVPVSLDDAVANMKVIEAAFTSAKSESWVTLG
jgi:predicted dehydrogenase